MNNVLIYSVSVLTGLILYVIIYCSINTNNCKGEKYIHLPLGKEFMVPFIELFNGRISLFFRLIFSLNTPWFFIMMSLIIARFYIFYINLEDEDNNENKEKLSA